MKEFSPSSLFIFFLITIQNSFLFEKESSIRDDILSTYIHQ